MNRVSLLREEYTLASSHELERIAAILADNHRFSGLYGQLDTESDAQFAQRILDTIADHSVTTLVRSIYQGQWSYSRCRNKGYYHPFCNVHKMPNLNEILRDRLRQVINHRRAPSTSEECYCNFNIGGEELTLRYNSTNVRDAAVELINTGLKGLGNVEEISSMVMKSIGNSHNKRHTISCIRQLHNNSDLLSFDE